MSSSLPFDINVSNEDCVVRPDNFGHDVINFCDMRLVNVLTQNPVQAVTRSFGPRNAGS